MPRSPRFPAPDRPDPEARLLAAVAERDGLLARRLAEQFVHRRGVAALEGLLVRKLEPTQGAEACGWLAALVGVEAPAADPWAPVDSGLDWSFDSNAATVTAPALATEAIESPAAARLSSGTAEEPGAALIASWLADLGREQAELSELAEAWKPAAEPAAEPLVAAEADAAAAMADQAQPEAAGAEAAGVQAPGAAEPPLVQAPVAVGQAAEPMVFGGQGSSAAAAASATPLSLAESSFDNPFQMGSLAASEPEGIALTPPLPLPAQQPDAEPVLRRLRAVATPDGQRAGSSRPAPVPASLARLRAWLHDDQLPEAS